MQCVILAGGLGTRMKGVAGGLPKALFPVGPRTFIDWQLEWLKMHGVSDVVLALGVGGELVQKHVEGMKGDKRFPSVAYSFDGGEPLGTGGAIFKAEALLEAGFLVTYGDTFLTLDVEAIFAQQIKSGLGATMAIYRNQNAGDRSNVSFVKGKIARFDKFHPTPDMDYIDYGMSGVDKDYFFSKAKAGKFDYADFLSRACEQGQVGAFVVSKPFYEIGSPEGYKGFCALIESSGWDLQKLKPP